MIEENAIVEPNVEPKQRKPRKKNGDISWVQTFVDTYEVCLNLTKTCDLMGINFSTYYSHYKKSKTFQKRIDEIRQTLVPKLEEVAWDRAIKDKKDNMIQFMLRNHLPEVYSEKTTITDNIKIIDLGLASRKDD